MTDDQERIGKYVLGDRIALGGMAEIFRAKTYGAAGFVKDVCIKRILPQYCDDPDFVAMFIDEATLAANLQHVNIVQILDFDRAGESYYIAMELVEGKDLKQIMTRAKELGRAIPLELGLYVIAEALRGLAYAHSRKVDGRPLGIIHRDVSPHNILVSYQGEVKLTDFGIAKAAERSLATQAGHIKGKLSYMSPEQVSGRPVDQRSDFFAMGVILFELVTGTRLFAGRFDAEIVLAVKRAEVPPPHTLNPEIRPDLERILLRMLAKDVENRPSRADKLVVELTSLGAYKSAAAKLGQFLRSLFASEVYGNVKNQGQETDEMPALGSYIEQTGTLGTTPGGMGTSAGANRHDSQADYPASDSSRSAFVDEPTELYDDEQGAATSASGLLPLSQTGPFTPGLAPMPRPPTPVRGSPSVSLPAGLPTPPAPAAPVLSPRPSPVPVPKTPLGDPRNPFPLMARVPPSAQPPTTVSRLDNADKLVGRTLADRYLVEQRMGETAIAVVYRARQIHTDRAVQIKVLHSVLARDPSWLARFRAETQAASRLTHPNTVSQLDFGEVDGRAYLVSEYVDGRTLRELLQAEHHMGAPRALRIVSQMLRSLTDAHHVAVVHRDLRPETIMLADYAGVPDFVKVADFSLAKILNDGPASQQTAATAVLVSPKYMSPEQASGMPVDARTDIYSVGAIAYEMLVGVPPFDAVKPSELHAQVLDKPPPPLSRPDLVVDPRVEALILKALEKVPDRRYADASQMLAACEACLATLLAESEGARSGALTKALAEAAPAAAATAAPPAAAPSSTATAMAAAAGSRSASAILENRRRNRPLLAILAALLILALGGGAAYLFLLK